MEVRWRIKQGQKWFIRQLKGGEDQTNFGGGQTTGQVCAKCKVQVDFNDYFEYDFYERFFVVLEEYHGLSPVIIILIHILNTISQQKTASRLSMNEPFTVSVYMCPPKKLNRFQTFYLCILFGYCRLLSTKQICT